MIKKISLLLIAVLLIGVCGCGSNATIESATPEKEVSTSFNGMKNLTAETITFSDAWDYDVTSYGEPNEDAKDSWEEFKQLRDAGAPTDEIISVLSEVVCDDEQFVPGYIEYARYYLIDFNETGDPTSPTNAMNTLSYGEAYTKDPMFATLKESLGWSELVKIVEKAKDALANNDYAGAFEIINTLPERYFGILDADQIIETLNFFNDAYYYMIMGDALGNQYIVHFQIDGTYERVKMNQDGLYDTGTWETSVFEDWDIRVADCPFMGSAGNYFWNDFDGYGNLYEYKLTINKDGLAKEQFETIVKLGEEDNSNSDNNTSNNDTSKDTNNNSSTSADLTTILTSKNWQTDEGWYYTFNSDGTGKISMTDDSYSYDFEYWNHDDNANAITIMSLDVPEDYTWIYDPAKGTFKQESYGYDVTTDTASVYYKDVRVYNK